jgi:hypothetical protein
VASELVCNEEELKMVCRQLERFYTRLESSFDKYEQIMGSIPGGGLEDAAISGSIRRLEGMAALQRTRLMSTLAPLSHAMGSHISGIASMDNFDYQEPSVGDIISLLASFL